MPITSIQKKYNAKYENGTKAGLLTHAGFTLMEVMVSVTIFTLVVTVGIVSLLTINEAYRKSQTQRQSIDSLTYVLESMSRRIRTAREWDIPPASFGYQQTSITIIDQDGIEVIYGFDTASAVPKITMNIDNCPGGTNCPSSSQIAVGSGLYDLTPTNVTIDSMSFRPMVSAGPVGQSYIQLNIAGTVTEAKQTTSFTFQTGISKRALDVPTQQLFQ
jgi:prepilin-type N-terminal cleavage/methylation domain-containing protein